MELGNDGLDPPRVPPPPRLPLFPLGQIVATPGALETMARLGIDPMTLLARHVTGDWGDLDDHDQSVNNDAVQHGGRLVSAYGTGEDKLWVITEADRSITTFLRPEEY